jgi:predicted secreted protein
MYAIAVLLLALTQAAATPPAEPTYKKIAITEPDVQEAVKVVFAKQKGTLISAERRSISGNNIRLCITMNRSSSYEFALVVLSRDKTKKLWTVDTWSWGSCGR